MSRRFGRNQRRQARERIAALEQAVAMNRGLLAHVSERKRQLEQEISDAKRIAGRMSVLFEPEAKRLDGPARGLMYLFTNSSVMDDPSPFFHAKSETVPLPVMLSRIDKSVLDKSIHCSVMFDDMKWNYALSEMAVQAMPKELLVERVAMRLARQIGEDLETCGSRY